MIRALLILMTGLIVSFFVFPVTLFILPMNLKMLLAIIGLFVLGMQIVRYRTYEVNKQLFGAAFFALLYSVVNLVAVEINDQFDFSYANYITTFFVWVFAAYTTVELMRWVHGRVTIRLLVSYLAAVAACQCLLAIAIDKIAIVDLLISSITSTDFYKDGNRLYGLGAALDPAGVRFAAILVMIAFVMVIDERVKSSRASLTWFMVAFILIAILGNMIARTTTVGLLLALGVIGLSTGLYRLSIEASNVRMYSIFGTVLLVGIPLAIYLYHTDEFFYEQMRYGFEGFFNYVETGEFRTHSTDILATMWQWPETTKGWIIGLGIYDNFIFGTDIGYCRLILYSGLVGFTAFSLLFVFNTYVFINKYPRYRYMFLVLLAMSFIIWYKVSTDLFQFWALLYVFVDEEEADYLPKLSLV